MKTGCPLCSAESGRSLWREAQCRVVAVDDPDIPGFLRIILNAHAAEMTDIPAREQSRLIRVVLATEAIVRQCLKPDKVNLASLGNVVPHVHWHVIPRWRDDRWFPDPIWATPRRESAVPSERLRRAEALYSRFAEDLAGYLQDDVSP